MVTVPQDGILPESSAHGLFVSLDIEPGGSNLSSVRFMLQSCPRLTSALAQQYPEAGLVSVAAIAPGIWDQLTGKARPALLRQFTARVSGRHKAPATPTDLLLHIRSARRDLNFELFRQLLDSAGESLRVVEEIPGFRYLDSRDLTGFVDGTENPEGSERADVALVGSEDPPACGGSYVLAQRYVHDLQSWRQLETDDQERVIGRTRETDQELEDRVRPASAHISRVVVEEEGRELQILRHSLPYGNSQQAGLMFLAYSRNLKTFDRILDRMFDQEGDGVYDRLLDFTRAETGAFYFAPSIEVLQSLV